MSVSHGAENLCHIAQFDLKMCVAVLTASLSTV